MKMVLGVLAAVWLIACSGSDNSLSDVPTWSFSGVILDGSSDSALSGAVVDYLDATGVRQSVGTNSRGEFFIGSLPYGQRTFHFSCQKRDALDSLVLFGERVVTASSYNESSSMPGALAGTSRVMRLFPLTGSVGGTAIVQVDGSGAYVPAKSVVVELIYRDTTFLNLKPLTFFSRTDSTGAFKLTGLPADSGLQVYIPRFQQDGRWYSADLVNVPRLISRRLMDIGRQVINSDTASDYVEPIAASNVLDGSGLGLSGIGLGTVPWFRIAFPFDPTRLDVQLRTGTTSIPVVAIVRGDTVFLTHADRLPSDTSLTTEISGLNSTGKKFHVLLDGNRRFKTVKALTAIESNTWSTSSSYHSEANLLDTLWVRFSEKLSTDLGQLQWNKASIARTIYGRGLSANAQVWVRAETLFVVPDQRMKLDTTGKMGFSVVATSASGSHSAALEFSIDIAATAYSIKWTNTVNALGIPRDDMGSMDSILVVSNRPIARLLGFSAADNSILPPGIQAADVRLRGDTLVFKPSMTMTPNTTYGLGFDLQAPNGVVYRKALQVRWRTVYATSIVSVNNRDGSEYRRFRSLGDSLVVRFSQSVDTSKAFVIHMNDARGNAVQTKVTWNATADVATIFNTTPLPTANFGISTTTNASGDTAKSVANVTFDLTSKSGERLYALQPAYDTLRLYSEDGLCAVASNLLKSHSSQYEILSTEPVVDSFPTTSAVTVTFNRPLDTAWMALRGDSTYVNLQLSTGSVVPCDISFQNGGKTIVLTPRAPLASGSFYYVQFVKIPGLGIRDALPIGRHGGTFNGTTTSGFLVGSSFPVR